MNEAVAPLQLLLLLGGAFGAAGTVLGGVAWMLREKIARVVIVAVVESSRVAAWVDARVAKVLEDKADGVIDARIKERFGSTKPDWDAWRDRKDERDRATEVRVGKVESAMEVMAKVAESLKENGDRTTKAVEAIAKEVTEQGKTLAANGATLELIATTIERRSAQR